MNRPETKPVTKPIPKTVPGTAIASMATNSMTPFPMNLFLTTRKATSMEMTAVMILATSDVHTVFHNEEEEVEKSLLPISFQFAVVHTILLISRFLQKEQRKTRT